MMDHRWVTTSPPSKAKPSKHKVIRDRQDEQKVQVAAIHKRLRVDFYSRTAPKWGIRRDVQH